jgi:hypothetical protein
MMARMMESPPPLLVVKIEIVTEDSEERAKITLAEAIKAAGYRINEISFTEAPQ